MAPERYTVAGLLCWWCVWIFGLDSIVALSTNATPRRAPPTIRGRRRHIDTAIQQLEKYGISSSTPSSLSSNVVYKETTRDVIDILKQWQHQDDDAWKSLLNKNNLLHEVEESIVALHYLREWAKTRRASLKEFVAVDVCCGKGLFSLLLSYLAAKHHQQADADLGSLSRIILLDKDSSIDWSHVDAANSNHVVEGRPVLELWKRTNLHDYDYILDKLQSYNQPLALTGIHLCKTLSPALVGLANGLGPLQAPYLCLAPCCLPRLATQRRKNNNSHPSLIPIVQYEGPMQQSARLHAMRHLKASKIRRRSKCYVCQGDHHVRDCPQQEMYPTSDAWNEAVTAALQSLPCWNCGKTGHRRNECTEPAPQRVELPKVQMDLSTVTKSDTPFESYCQVLAQQIQSVEKLEVIDSGLTSLSHQSRNRQCHSSNNWNQNRKSLYIVASRQDCCGRGGANQVAS